MTQRSLSFGEVAETYERFRPGYPDELIGWVTAVAEDRVVRAIEIGAGTGKATRVFAAAGIDVVATEPDPAMLAVLARECAGLPVTPVPAALEDVDVAAYEPFDLLFAAAAWHWTRPQTRWDLATRLVRPGGALAFFGGPYEIAHEPTATLEAEIIARYAPDGRHVPSPSGGAGPMSWPGDEMLADPRLADVREREVRRRLTLTRADYVRHLDTISAIRMVPDADRERLFADLTGALPDEIVVRADLMLHTARRR